MFNQFTFWKSKSTVAPAPFQEESIIDYELRKIKNIISPNNDSKRFSNSIYEKDSKDIPSINMSWNSYTLEFIESSVNLQFDTNLQFNIFKSVLLSRIIFSIVFLITSIFSIVHFHTPDWFAISNAVLSLTFLVFSFTRLFELYYFTSITFYLLCSSAERIIYFHDNFDGIWIGIFLLLSCFMYQGKFFPFLLVSFFDFTFHIIWKFYAVSVINDDENFHDEYIIVCLHGLMIILLVTSTYFYEVSVKSKFVLSRNMDKIHNCSQRVLDDIFPQYLTNQIKKRLDGEQNVVAREESCVTILFIDVVGIKALLPNKTTLAVALMLDSIFRILDDLCDKYSVEKMETACGGLPGTRRDHANAIVELSLEIIEIVKNIPMAIKAGINSGQVISGIVGLHRPQFSLFGDSINTASRICSTGLVGKVQCSKSCHDMIKTDFVFSEREVDAKGKGLMTVYVVENKSPILIEKKVVHGLVPCPIVRSETMYILSSDEILDGYMNSLTLEYVSDDIPGAQYSSKEILDAIKNDNLSGDLDGMDAIFKDSYFGNVNIMVDSDKSFNFHIPPATPSRKTSAINSGPFNSFNTLRTPTHQTPKHEKRNSFSLNSQTDALVLSKHIQPNLTPKHEIRNSFSLNSQTDALVASKHIQPMVPVTSQEPPKNEVRSYFSLNQEVLTNSRPIQPALLITRNEPLKNNEVRSSFSFNSQDVFNASKPTFQTPKHDISKQEVRSSHSLNSQSEVLITSKPFQLKSPSLRSKNKLNIPILSSELVSAIDDNSSTTSFQNDFATKLLGASSLEEYYEMTKFQTSYKTTALIGLIGAAYFIFKMFEDGFDYFPFYLYQAIIFRLSVIIHGLVLTTAYFFYEKLTMQMYAPYIYYWKIIYTFHCFFVLVYAEGILNLGEVQTDVALAAFLIISLANNCELFLIHLTTLMAIFAVAWTIYVSIFSSFQLRYFILLISVYAAIGLNVLFTYTRLSFARRKFILRQLVSIERKVTESFLEHMVPITIANQMRAGIRRSIINSYQDCTILYADLMGFTSFCANHTPQEVVLLLSDIFSNFDKSVAKHGCYKVQTIGDGYVCVSGFEFLPKVSPKDNASNCVQVGWDMIRTIAALKDHPLNMRVGIHTGSIVAGCIGSKKIRFDIWGANQLLANKIESTSKPNCVRISSTTYDLLQQVYTTTLYEPVHCDVSNETFDTFFIYPQGEYESSVGDYDLPSPLFSAKNKERRSSLKSKNNIPCFNVNV